MKKIWMILAVLCVFPAFAAAQSPFETFYEKWSSENSVSSVYVTREMLDFAGAICFGQDEGIDGNVMIDVNNIVIEKLDHIFTMSASQLAMYKCGMEKDLERILKNSSGDYKTLVKINENPEKLTIYYRENGVQSEIIVVSYTDPDGGEYLSDPDPNNTQVNIVVLVGDITSENIGKMIFGSKNASETAGQE